jgi:hypothetical protein
MLRSIAGVLAVLAFLTFTHYASADEKAEMGKIAGSWESGDVKDSDGKGTGVIKLTLTADGHGDLEIAAKRGKSSSSSKRSFTYHVVEKENEKVISCGIGVNLAYRIENDSLILTGTVASRRISYELTNVALKRAAK